MSVEPVAKRRRTLKANPSTTEDLQQWQNAMLSQLQQLLDSCFQEHRALTKMIQQFPRLVGQAALQEISYAVQCAWNLPHEEAQAKAAELLQPGPASFKGSKQICILSWSFEEHSLWRGLSDNTKLIKLARSMVSAGFREDEPVNARTLDLTAEDGVLAGKLLFGDGQARGLAARLAFQLILGQVRQSNRQLIGNPEIMRIMQSLIQIPTVFAGSGDNTEEDMMVAQAVRQNVKASMQLPHKHFGVGRPDPKDLQGGIGPVHSADLDYQGLHAQLHAKV